MKYSQYLYDEAQNGNDSFCLTVIHLCFVDKSVSSEVYPFTVTALFRNYRVTIVICIEKELSTFHQAVDIFFFLERYCCLNTLVIVVRCGENHLKRGRWNTYKVIHKIHPSFTEQEA